MFDEPLFSIAGHAVTLGLILPPIVAVALTLVVLFVLERVFSRLQTNASPARKPTVYIIGQVLRYLVIFVGIGATISAMGLSLASLSLFAGALGVGIGLGLQDIVKNFFSGIILLFDQSIEVGDFIELEDGARGMVVSIGPRATTIRTNDNVDILVPNSTLLNSNLTNWTRDQHTRRIHVPFGVAYSTELDKVRQAAIDAARSVPFTREDTEGRTTQVWLTNFGPSSLDFELVVWPDLEAVKKPGSMMAAYRWALMESLVKHGIEIPFPQQEIRVRSVFGEEGENALKAINPSAKARSHRASRTRKTGKNDAASDALEKDA